MPNIFGTFARSFKTYINLLKGKRKLFQDDITFLDKNITPKKGNCSMSVIFSDLIIDESEFRTNAAEIYNYRN